MHGNRTNVTAAILASKNRTNAIVLAPCKICGKKYDERGIKAAFGYCLVCHEKESLSPEMPFFKVTCQATWMTHNGEKMFFLHNQIYRRTDWPEKVIRVLIAGFYGRQMNGKMMLLKYYCPLKEGTDNVNR